MNLFYGKAKSGKVEWSNNKAVLDYLLSVENEKLVIRLDREKAMKSENLHRYYWVYLREIGIQKGYTEDQLHQLFKRMFLPPVDIEVLGRRFKVPRSHTDLTKSQMWQYMYKINEFTKVEMPVKDKLKKGDLPEYPTQDITPVF